MLDGKVAGRPWCGCRPPSGRRSCHPPAGARARARAPGYFFDFPREGHWYDLLTPPHELAEGVERLLRVL